MIPVDLNRLREARTPDITRMSDPQSMFSYLGEQVPLLQGAIEALLDAPTVWWCEAYRGGTGHMDEPCVAGSKHDYPMPCRFVNLVPVKGES